MFDRISGNRIMLSLCKVGGMKKDISTQQLEDIHNTIENLGKRSRHNASGERRCIDMQTSEGIGVLMKRLRKHFYGGPVARGSAVK